MATREEHLKKINDELEQLNDAELEKVAGGTCVESARDSKVLNDLLAGTKYHQCKRYGTFSICFDHDARDDVKAAWNSLGIDVETNNREYNKYFLNGKEISRTAAQQYAKDLVGYVGPQGW